MEENTLEVNRQKRLELDSLLSHTDHKVNPIGSKQDNRVEMQSIDGHEGPRIEVVEQFPA